MAGPILKTHCETDQVTYTVDGFVLKNSDAMHADMVNLMECCDALAPVMQQLIGSAPLGRTSTASVQSTISMARSRTGSTESITHSVSPVRSPQLEKQPSAFAPRPSLLRAKVASTEFVDKSSLRARLSNASSETTHSKETPGGKQTRSTTLSARLRAGIGQATRCRMHISGA